MQNKEAEDVYDKKARFVLFKPNGDQFTEASVLGDSAKSVTITGSRYYVFWYDSKMKNYQLLIEYILNKRLIQADIQPVLVVDKESHMEKVLEIWQNSTKDMQANVRDRCQILLKRDLTDQEQLLRTFGDGSETTPKKEPKREEKESENESEEDKKDEDIDLDLKKNFYYVIGPESEVVDCAKIYSFLHEDNIFKRITARVSKHVDSKVNPGEI